MRDGSVILQIERGQAMAMRSNVGLVIARLVLRGSRSVMTDIDVLDFS